MLHGAKRTTWTRLATSASKGAQTIQVVGTPDWKVNDMIVIASTSFYSANIYPLSL